MVKKLVKYQVELLATFFGKVLSIFPKKVLRYFISTFFKKLSKYSDYYYTYHARPKNWEDVHYSNIFKEQDYSHIGIVVQGPIVSEDDFTLNTVLLYRNLFPNITIIVSTWIDTDSNIVELFKKNKIEILLLARPKVSGSHNINFQIVSTVEGIKYLENKNIKFICKTRSDQRIYSENSFKYLEHLIYQYPVQNEIAKGRIIEPSISVCKYRPWSMTDMFQFGYLEDMKRMWDIQLDDRSVASSHYGQTGYRIIDIVQDNIAEIYIHRKYASLTNSSFNIDYKDYYKTIMELFIVIDKESLDLYWNKYEPTEYGLAVNPLYSENQLLSRIYHSDWILMNNQNIDFNNIEGFLYKKEHN